MKLRTGVALIAAGAATAAGVATVAAPRAGVAITTATGRSPELRIVTSVATPRPTWRGGLTWRVYLADTLDYTDRTPTTAGRLVDSIWTPIAPCATYRVTVAPDTVVTAAGRVSTRRDSLTRRVTLCRPPTAREVAVRDSYPTPRLAFCEGRRAVRPATLFLAIGETRRFVLADTNRYTRAFRPVWPSVCP